MRLFLKIVRGFVLGMAAVLPAISGGTLALSMGVYEQLIEAVTGFFKRPLYYLKLLAPYIAGAGLGALAAALVIEQLFDIFPIQTRMAFIGMLLGALPMLAGRMKGAKLGASNILALLIMAALVVGTTLFTNPGIVRTFEPTPLMYLLMVGLGAIVAATLVIPGISGTMIMMLLGYYQTVLGGVNTLVRAVFSGGEGLVYGLQIAIPFGIGLLVGAYACAWMIKALMKRFPITTNMAVIGLIIASPFGIMYGCNLNVIGPLGWVASAGLLAAGFLVTWRMGGEGE